MSPLSNISDIAAPLPAEIDYGAAELELQRGSGYLLIATNVVNYIGITVAMFGMGCVISIKDFSRKEMHLAKCVMIGIALQVLIQPLMGYILAKFLNMTTFDALAMVLLSCCPVSPYCAVLVYYGDGYVIVGLCLAMFTTALSIGLVPFWYAFYSSSISEEYYVIASPRDVALTQALIFVPVGAGVALKKLIGQKRAAFTGKVCSTAFLMAIIVGPILNAIEHPSHFSGDWQLWVGAILLPFIGFLCGSILSYILSLPYEACSAVSLAVGTPNWFIASAAAWRFFSSDVHALNEILTLVSIFSITMPIEGFVWSVMFRAVEEFVLKIYPKCCKPEVDDNDDSDSEDDEKVVGVVHFDIDVGVSSGNKETKNFTK